MRPVFDFTEKRIETRTKYIRTYYTDENTGMGAGKALDTTKNHHNTVDMTSEWRTAYRSNLHYPTTRDN
ncbi:MAG: hypothetical protein LBV26_08760 [Bacteroidales bacterium]|nr:hypothetical protein [Bacteroidales bacterium]